MYRHTFIDFVNVYQIALMVGNAFHLFIHPPKKHLHQYMFQMQNQLCMHV